MTDPDLPVAAPAPAPPGEDPWRLPRHLGLAAVAVVGVLVAGGWLLNWWGPLNPRVSVWAGSSIVRPSTGLEATVQVTNRSLTDLTVTDGRFVTDEASTLENTAVRLARVHDDGDGSWWSTLEADGEALPATVEPGETVMLLLTATEPTCEPDGTRDIRTSGVAVDVRSAWGRDSTHTLPTGRSSSETCTPPLPPETSPPADRAAAVDAIGAAFATAYDGELDQATREGRVDDPRGLAETTAHALAGPFGDLVATVRPVVTEVSFDRAGHASVRYRLGSSIADPRTGEAVLVDGTWKVTRATVCADLALANATCPPLPR